MSIGFNRTVYGVRSYISRGPLLWGRFLLIVSVFFFNFFLGFESSKATATRGNPGDDWHVGKDTHTQRMRLYLGQNLGLNYTCNYARPEVLDGP